MKDSCFGQTLFDYWEQKKYLTSFCKSSQMGTSIWHLFRKAVSYVMIMCGAASYVERWLKDIYTIKKTSEILLTSILNIHRSRDILLFNIRMNRNLKYYHKIKHILRKGRIHEMIILGVMEVMSFAQFRDENICQCRYI